MKKYEVRKNNILIYLSFMMAIVVFILAVSGDAYRLDAYAAPSEDSYIRVGLEALYYNKGSITIRNSSLVVGYSIDNSYHKEMTLSNGAYTFKPFTKNISYIDSFKSYEDAVKEVEKYKKNGKEAYPVISYLNTWSVAIANEGNADKYAIMVSDGTGKSFIYTSDSRGAYPQFMAGSANNNGVFVVDMGERQYRGRIEIGRYGSSNLKAISIVDMEEYLYGVVPCEMVSSWHSEALKTQAVCARSYAYTAGFGSKTNFTKPYNLCDTTSSQVYKGYGAERKSTNDAVDATKGKLLYYKGKPVRAYYSSTSGGSTENVEDVWGTPYGYLRQVSDIYELEPELNPWIKTLKTNDIEQLMKENGISVGTIKDIRPFVMTASGRVQSVEIIGDKSEVITGSKLRKIFSLYSTKYKVIKYGDNPDYVSAVTKDGQSAVEISDSFLMSGNGNIEKPSDSIEQFVVMTADNLINYPANAPAEPGTFYIAGMGYGHGVGMSQSGAKGMAEAGFNYEEILKHYYTGVEVR